MTRPLLIERSRGLLRIRGRDPVRMIHGLATADIQAVIREQGAYTTFLTAKGRMVADARVFRRDDGDQPELLLDVAPTALEPLLAHIRRFVPPLFARADDVSGDWAVLGVYGAGASGVVAAVAPDAGEDQPEERVAELGDGDSAFAVRTGITGEDGWDLFVPVARRDLVEEVLLRGASPGSGEVLESLRVLAGRPRWGRELTEDVIPLEAGLLDRAISQSKGCYTGQEVIVRILHRGHVNRHLRRLVFEGGTPEPGTELYEPDNERARGVVTSAVANEAGALGLGYVRREVEPPAELRVGAPDGPRVRVEAVD
jgi:tRNA-modifying protein YgfZ